MAGPRRRATGLAATLLAAWAPCAHALVPAPPRPGAAPAREPGARVERPVAIALLGDETAADGVGEQLDRVLGEAQGPAFSITTVAVPGLRLASAAERAAPLLARRPAALLLQVGRHDALSGTPAPEVAAALDEVRRLAQGRGTRLLVATPVPPDCSERRERVAEGSCHLAALSLAERVRLWARGHDVPWAELGDVLDRPEGNVAGATAERWADVLRPLGPELEARQRRHGVAGAGGPRDGARAPPRP